MSGFEKVNRLLDELEVEIDSITTSSKQSGQSAQAARLLEKSIEELKSKRIRVPEQMLTALENYRAQISSQDTSKLAGEQVYEKLTQLLRKLPRPTPGRPKMEGVTKDRCRQIILEVLLLNGGEASRQFVLGKAEELLQSELTDYDIEVQQKGKPRWHAQMLKAHEGLRLDGQVSDGSAPGLWVSVTP